MIPFAIPPSPAYVIVDGATRRLAQSSYCWRTTCADYVRPRCGDRRTPTVRVRKRQRARFRIGFDPTQVGLIYVGRLEVRYVLRFAASRTVAWRVRAFTGRDEFILTARSALGDTSYAVCFRTR
jgi:hypothetical protein